jgi:toxin ParE1/3/4
MRKLHLSPAASEDLENILQFTLDSWGEKQFEVYLSFFQETFDSIQKDPECLLSQGRDEIFKACRSIRSGHHVVFYRLKNKNIEIIRILHEKMDFSRHFEEEE